LHSKKARLGALKAITATAHKLLRHPVGTHLPRPQVLGRDDVLKYGTPYVEVGEEEYERRYRRRVLANLRRKARALGFTLVEIPTPALNSSSLQA